MSTQAADGEEGSRASLVNIGRPAAEPTGYGPTQVLGTAMPRRGLPLQFDGDKAHFHVWEARFLAYLKTIGLKEAML